MAPPNAGELATPANSDFRPDGATQPAPACDVAGRPTRTFGPTAAHCCHEVVNEAPELADQ
jgi:hypothetical protein